MRHVLSQVGIAIASLAAASLGWFFIPSIAHADGPSPPPKVSLPQVPTTPPKVPVTSNPVAAAPPVLQNVTQTAAPVVQSAPKPASPPPVTQGSAPVVRTQQVTQNVTQTVAPVVQNAPKPAAPPPTGQSPAPVVQTQQVAQNVTQTVAPVVQNAPKPAAPRPTAQSPAPVVQTQPVAQNVTQAGAPVGQSAPRSPAPQAAQSPAPVAQTPPVGQNPAQTVAPVAQNTGSVVDNVAGAPVTQNLAATIAPVLPMVAPVTQTPAPGPEIVGPVVRTVTPIVQPLVQVASLTETLANVGEPLVAPLGEAVSPLAQPLLDIARPHLVPVLDVVGPLSGALPVPYAAMWISPPEVPAVPAMATTSLPSAVFVPSQAQVAMPILDDGAGTASAVTASLAQDSADAAIQQIEAPAGSASSRVGVSNGPRGPSRDAVPPLTPHQPEGAAGVDLLPAPQLELSPLLLRGDRQQGRLSPQELVPQLPLAEAPQAAGAAAIAFINGVNPSYPGRGALSAPVACLFASLLLLAVMTRGLRLLNGEPFRPGFALEIVVPPKI